MQTNIFEMSASDGGGSGTSKLPRTQTVSVRLDPKLRYLCEIAARRQRRTISSFIEWALEHSLDDVVITDSDGNSNSIGHMAAQLWDVESADRFAKLALNYPDLLNHHEEILWKLIRESGYVWRGWYPKGSDEWEWVVKEGSLNFGRLRQHWDLINRIARGEADKSELPQVVKRAAPPKPNDDVAPMDDEDIPF